MTRVYPDFNSRKGDNFDPRIAWSYGCQFVCMNFNRQNHNMIVYWKKFIKSSFVLKPKQLRLQPIYIPPPRPANKDWSMAVRQKVLPSGVSIAY